MLEKTILMLIALAACIPGIGYSIYLWKENKRGAAIGNVIPGIGCIAFAILLLSIT